MKKALSLIVAMILVLAVAVPALAERTLTWNEVNGETYGATVAAHAFTEYAGGRHAAAWGDASVLSFHATKLFSTVAQAEYLCVRGRVFQGLPPVVICPQEGLSPIQGGTDRHLAFLQGFFSFFQRGTHSGQVKRFHGAILLPSD